MRPLGRKSNRATRPAVRSGLFVIVALVAGFVWPACRLVFSQPPSAGESSPPTAGQIARWIEELSADSFYRREDAAARLTEAGLAAIGPLAVAADSADAERTARATRILQNLSLSEPTAEPALRSLSKLASRTAAQRRAALAELERRRQDRLVAELRRGGATIVYEAEPITGSPGLYIRLDEEWQGGIEALATIAQLDGVVELQLHKLPWDDRQLNQLQSLKSLEDLQLYYVPISDAGLDHVAALKRLWRVQLFGTKVTADGESQLARKRPGLLIDRRSGGLLGIAGRRGEEDGGCRVDGVQPDTAAEKAGIRPGDLITAIDGQKIDTFDDLTAVLAAQAAGREIEIDYLRDGATHRVRVTLGEWP